MNVEEERRKKEGGQEDRRGALNAFRDRFTELSKSVAHLV